MLKLYRGLVDAKFLNYAQVNFGYLSGSVEFDSSGKGINQDAKYNQWDFQQKQLPAYADHEFDGSRSGAINAMRLMATVANASPLTDTTVAKETYSPQDRSYGVGFTPASTDTSVRPHDGAGGVSCHSGKNTAKSPSVRPSA
jgi:hypothetical protein